MKDYTKECWSCGKSTMVKQKDHGKDWLKCSNCGATDILNPTSPGGLGYGGTYTTPDGRIARSSKPVGKGKHDSVTAD